MTAEYSYFHAEGFSREAIDIARESKQRLYALRGKISAAFGASLVQNDGGARQALVFHAAERVPDDWRVAAEKRFTDGSLQSVTAAPPPGSEAALRIAGLCGLMRRSERLSTLEGVFNCAAMPQRSHEAGEFETSFVRERFMKGGTAGKVGGEWTGRPLKADKPGQEPDPLAVMELKGEFYIRVPNLPGTETPAFVPPDAKPVSFRKIVEADAQEMEMRIEWAKNNPCIGC